MRGKSSAVSEGGASAKLVKGTLQMGMSSARAVFSDGSSQYPISFSRNTTIDVAANTLLWLFAGDFPAGVECTGGVEKVDGVTTTEGVFWVTDDFTITAV